MSSVIVFEELSSLVLSIGKSYNVINISKNFNWTFLIFFVFILVSSFKVATKLVLFGIRVQNFKFD